MEPRDVERQGPDRAGDPVEAAVAGGPAPAEAPGGEALWRRDFPLTSAGEEQITRREFTRYLLAASAAFAVSTVGAGVWATVQSAPSGGPQQIVALADVPEGASYLFAYPTSDDPAMLLHLPGGELRAFSQKCTHLGCVVVWQPDRDRVFCPCHEGVFDPDTGEPTAGPPVRALSRIDVEVRQGVVWATGVTA